MDDLSPTAQMECSIYQNYSASEVLVQSVAGMVNQQDVEAMVRAQKKMLQRFEKTNEMLSNCNTLSATRLERAMRDFKGHTTLVLEMKKDLDIVLRRIHNLKTRLASQHPEAFRVAGGQDGPIAEEDDEYDVMIKEKRSQEVAPSPTGARPKH
eukprot:maker-scaffold990_size72856-snap-gene-0.15 protein:Tk06266 transcript:maker-scaffold990_size72856-snap-gene-0.15-mRNA-1 annotation:"MSTP096"